MNEFLLFFSFSCVAVLLAALFVILFRKKKIKNSRNGKKAVEKGNFDHSAEDVQNFEKLIKLVENEKVFTNPNLTVNELSEYLNLHPKKVSLLINYYSGMNFHQLINKYRVAESKKLLLDPSYSNLTMQGIAKEAGFNSRSVFNLAFKAEVGKTPSDFKKQAV